MKNILVPVDFSDVAGLVVDTAACMAKLTGAALTLLHIAAPEPDFVGYEPGPVSVRNTVAQQLRDEHRKLQAMEHRIAGHGFAVTSLLIQGFASEKILHEAARVQADMIVMGSHGHGLIRHLVVGSVTDGVLRKATCPVLIVPSGPRKA
jgi:nucleotide-binding universal stress UspA family protein